MPLRTLLQRAPKHLRPRGAQHVIRRRPIRTLAALAVAAVLASVVVVALPAEAAVWSPFVQVFDQNAHGNIAIAANTIVTCKAGTTDNQGKGNSCANAQNGTSAPWVNNYYTSQYVDVDGDPTTFDSSSSHLTIPADGAVLYAQLVWGGRMPNGSTAVGSNQSQEGTVRFTTPDGVVHPLTGAVATAPSTINPNPYQGSYDVTSLVAAARSGSYTVANVQTLTGGTDQYGGWALVVAYSDPTQVERNLTIYRGFANISNTAGSTTQALSFSGFTTPPNGQVKTEVGLVAYEGDRGNNDQFQGDSVDLQGSLSTTPSHITDAKNPVNDVFNSTIGTDGVDPGTRNPAYNNQLGFDADVINADGDLKNNETSATITLKTGGETYYPGVVTFASQLYDPQLNGTKSATVEDLNNDGQTDVGDLVDYSVSIRNDGLDAATGSTFFDAIPTGTQYVPGSLVVDGAKETDTAGDDLAEFAAAPIGHVVARFGAGASATSGGVVQPYSVAPSDVHTVAFKVQITRASTPGQQITNVADLSYHGLTTGEAGATATNVTLNVVPGGNAQPSAPTRILSLDPTPATPSLVIDLAGQVTGGTPKSTSPAYDVIATTDPSGGTVVDNHNGTVTYTPASTFAGRDVFTYTVQDAAGNRATGTVKIDVQDDAPVAVNDTANVSHTAPTTIDAAANDTDPNGDPLTVYSVTANGNTATEGQAAIALSSGATVAVSGGKVVYTPPTGASAGQTDTFTYLVQDSKGVRSVTPGTVSVTLKDAPPVANNVTLPGTQQNATTPVTMDPRTSDSDPDGDSLTVTGVGTAAHGTSSFTSGSVSYVPNSGYAGPDSFSYTISDGYGDTATATVSVAVAGPPTAQPDAFTAPGGAPSVSGNVITDPNGTDTDPNGSALTLTSIDPAPAGFTLTSQPDGSVTLTVPTNWVGTTAPLNYTVSNGSYSASSTVTFTVQNIAPTAPATGTTKATLPDAGGKVDLFALVTDPNVAAKFQQFTLTGATASNGATVHDNQDGTVSIVPASGSRTSILTYTVTDGVASVTSDVTVAFDDAPTAPALSTSIPTDGTADVDAAAASSDPDDDPVTLTNVGTATDSTGKSVGTASLTNGKVHYVPPTGYTGSVTIPYTVSDGTKSSTSTVTVTVQDAPPTAVDDSLPIGHRGSTALPVTANDTDPNQFDGTTTDPARDPITVHSATANGRTITEGQSLTTAAGGTLTLKNGQLTYTAPAAGLPTGATETFTYVPQDSHGAQAAKAGTVTLTAGNRAPTAQNGTITVLENGNGATLTPATDDPDGDPVTITGVSAPTQGGGTVTFTGTTVTYTPRAGYAGPDSFTYTVSDGQGGTATGTVTVKVDGPPAANPVVYTAAGSASAVVLGGNIIADGHDTDPNGDAVTLTSVTPCTTPSASDGTLTFSAGGNVSLSVPAGYVGTQVFDYSVTDGTSAATSTVTFTVNNIAPTATAGTATISSGSGGTVDVQGQVTDPNVQNGYQTLTTQTATVDAASAAKGATAVIQPGGTVKVTPAPGSTDPITLTYTVSDGVTTVQSTVTVNVVDGTAPIANPQTAHTATNTPDDVDVVSGDSDPDGDPISLKSVGTPVDGGGHPVGTASVVGGKVHYVPPTGFAGTVTIPYTITDGTFESSSTLTMVVDDAAPVAHPDSASAADYRQVTTTDVLANDTDANIPGTSQVLSISSATADQGATVRVVGSSLEVTPATGYRGTIAVDYVVSDGAGGSAAGRLTVTVGSASAILPSSQNTLTSSGRPVTVDLLAGSSAPDGGALTVASVGPALGADGLQHGTVSQSGSTITIAPAAGYTGALSVSFTVTDSSGVTTAGTIRMTVTAAPGGQLAHTGISPAPVLAAVALLLGSASVLLEIARRNQLRPDPRHLASGSA